MKALDVGSGHNPVRDSGWFKSGDTAAGVTDRLSYEPIEFTNMDGFHPNADVHHAMEDLPWPFPDDTFSLVFSRHSLEHVPRAAFVGVMREIYRVSKDGAMVRIRVPYWNSEAFAGDPTHWNPFCETTFRHFCLGGSLGTEYYVPSLFRADSMEFRFQPKFRFLPRRVLKELMHVWCGVCDEMWVTLEVVKEGFVPVRYKPRYKYGWTGPPSGHAALYGVLFWVPAITVVAAVVTFITRWLG